MMDRCYNPKMDPHKRWGNRGIKVHPDWHLFENFVRDMGEAPPDLSLERQDNDGDYGPGNCKWATKQEQSWNRRGVTPRPVRQEIMSHHYSGVPAKEISFLTGVPVGRVQHVIAKNPDGFQPGDST